MVEKVSMQLQEADRGVQRATIQFWRRQNGSDGVNLG
jgi:hypothetical protein